MLSPYLLHGVTSMFVWISIVFTWIYMHMFCYHTFCIIYMHENMNINNFHIELYTCICRFILFAQVYMYACMISIVFTQIYIHICIVYIFFAYIDMHVNIKINSPRNYYNYLEKANQPVILFNYALNIRSAHWVARAPHLCANYAQFMRICKDADWQHFWPAGDGLGRAVWLVSWVGLGLVGFVGSFGLGPAKTCLPYRTFSCSNHRRSSFLTPNSAPDHMMPPLPLHILHSSRCKGCLQEHLQWER